MKRDAMRMRPLKAAFVGVFLLLSACAGGDVREALRIMEVRPATGSADVWIRDPVWVRFSEPIDVATVTPERIVVSSAEVASLAKELSLSADGLTLSITLTQQPVLPATLTVALSRDIATADGRRLASPGSSWWWKLPAWQAVGGALNADPARDAAQPRIVVGPEGPLVAWREAAAGVSEVYVAGWIDGAWVPLGGALNHGPGNFAGRVRVAVDPTGAPVAVWAEWHGDDWNVYAKRWDGSVWAALGAGPLDADAARHAHGVDVVGDGAGLWATWNEAADDGMHINVRRWDGTDWTPVGGSATDPAWNAVGPSIALGQDGNPVVAVTLWCEDTLQDVRVARWTGAEWVALGGVVDVVAGRHADVQNVAVDLDDAPIIVWEESDIVDGEKTGVQIHAKRWDGATWVSLGGPLNVGDVAVYYAYDPALTIDAAGRPVAVWREGSAAGIRVFAKRWTGASWETMGGPVSDRWSELPDVAVDEEGVVYVTWYEWADDTATVFVKRFNELP